MLFHGPQKQLSISGGVPCGPTNVMLSSSYLYFSHWSENKIVGTCRELTNHPHVRKSTRDTPLHAPVAYSLPPPPSSLCTLSPSPPIGDLVLSLPPLIISRCRRYNHRPGPLSLNPPRSRVALSILLLGRAKVRLGVYWDLPARLRIRKVAKVCWLIYYVHQLHFSLIL
jgi:hypothetical protein